MTAPRRARLQELGRRHPWAPAVLLVAAVVLGMAAVPAVTLVIVVVGYWLAVSRLAPAAGTADPVPAWRRIAVAVLVWVAVGAGTAAVVSALVLFTWAILVLHQAAPVAALAGVVQALWIAVERARGVEAGVRDWTARGALLGVAGFGLVFAGSGGAATWWQVGVFLAAGVLGGAAAGARTATLLAPSAFRDRRVDESGPERKHRVDLRQRDAQVLTQPGSGTGAEGPAAAVPPAGAIRRPGRGAAGVAALAMLLGVIAVEGRLLWPRLERNLPTLVVSPADVDIAPGDARGTSWSGCFQFEGHAAGPTSGAGVHGGSARFDQQDGRLVVTLGGERELRGGVDGDGRFRVASERRTLDGSVLRERIDGAFVGRTGYRYRHRLTLLDPGGRVRNTIRHVGTGTGRPC